MLISFHLVSSKWHSKLPCAFAPQLTCALPPGSCFSTDLNCAGCCFASFNEPLLFHSHLLTFAHTQAQLPHPKIPALTLLLIIVLPFFSPPYFIKRIFYIYSWLHFASHIILYLVTFQFMTYYFMETSQAKAL